MVEIGNAKASLFLLLRARRMLPVHPSMRKGIVNRHENFSFGMGGRNKDLPYVEKPGWQEITHAIKMETYAERTEPGLRPWMHHVVFAMVG